MEKRKEKKKVLCIQTKVFFLQCPVLSSRPARVRVHHCHRRINLEQAGGFYGSNLPTFIHVGRIRLPRNPEEVEKTQVRGAA